MNVTAAYIPGVESCSLDTVEAAFITQSDVIAEITGIDFLTCESKWTRQSVWFYTNKIKYKNPYIYFNKLLVLFANICMSSGEK